MPIKSKKKRPSKPVNKKSSGKGQIRSIDDVHPDLRHYMEPAFTQQLLEHMHKAKIKALTPRKKA